MILRKIKHLCASMVLLRRTQRAPFNVRLSYYPAKEYDDYIRRQNNYFAQSLRGMRNNTGWKSPKNLALTVKINKASKTLPDIVFYPLTFLICLLIFFLLSLVNALLGFQQ